MEYYAGLDVSLEKTHICVLDHNGTVIFEASAASTPAAISVALNGAPVCRRVVFETGRMAPMLYHGLAELGVPVVCIESRQAYQALKTLATHKTDRNDARGLAQLARTGFFKPVHVKSLPAHYVRALIMARKKLVGHPARHAAGRASDRFGEAAVQRWIGFRSYEVELPQSGLRLLTAHFASSNGTQDVTLWARRRHLTLLLG